MALQERPDLVLLGKQAIDDDQNQTGQILAGRLAWPQATFASKKESLESEAEQARRPGLIRSAGGETLQVAREIDGGVETLELTLPAVVTVDLRLNKPRFASPRDHEGEEERAEGLPAASLGVDLDQKVVRRLLEPPRRSAGVKVADVAELGRSFTTRQRSRRARQCPTFSRRGAVPGEAQEGDAVGAHGGARLARRTGGTVTALVAGHAARPAAEVLAGHGVDVRLAEAPQLEHYLAESYAPVVADAAAAAGATWLVVAATAFGKDLLPRAAVLAGAAVATDVVALAGEGANVLLRRPMWAGNVLAEVELVTTVKGISVRPTEFLAAEKAGEGTVSPMAVSIPGPLRTRFVGFEALKSERPDLTDARVIVAGGRGTKGDFSAIEALADAFEGAVARAEPRSTPAGRRTTGRARPEVVAPSSTSPPASPARSSTWRA